MGNATTNVMPATPGPEDFLPTSSVVDILKASRGTVNRWADSGRLPVAAKAPGRRGANLFRRSDVEALREQLAAEARERAEALAGKPVSVS